MATQTQLEQETAAMIASMTEDQLLQFGEEEIVKGNLTFKPAISALPNTQRSADLKQRKIELIRRRRQEAEDERKRKEQEEAQKRLKEQEAKKLKAEQERRRKEEERRRREEEEQRAKMEGGLDQLMGHLVANTSVENVSCADGVTMANMLLKNDSLRRMDLEGNNLGTKAAAAFGEALKKNEKLFCLNLEANSLGLDQGGVVHLANSLKHNQDLQILCLGKNNLSGQSADAFNDALDKNKVLTQLDLSHNEIPPFTQQKIEVKMEGNRERAQFVEEFKSTSMIQVEAMRLETEAVQERRLARLRERLVKWNVQSQEEEKQLEDLLEELMAEYEERKAARKGKKGKKGKK
eukprot:g8388.t1